MSKLVWVDNELDIDVTSTLQDGSLGVVTNLHAKDIEKYRGELLSRGSNAQGVLPKGYYFINFTTDTVSAAGGVQVNKYTLWYFDGSENEKEVATDTMDFYMILQGYVNMALGKYKEGTAYWAPPNSPTVNVTDIKIFASHLNEALKLVDPSNNSNSSKGDNIVGVKTDNFTPIEIKETRDVKVYTPPKREVKIKYIETCNDPHYIHMHELYVNVGVILLGLAIIVTAWLVTKEWEEDD